MTDDEIEQHQLAGDLWRARMATVAVVFLIDGYVETSTEEVIDVASVGPVRNAARQTMVDETVEKVPHVLPVPSARKRSVLTPQAIPTVQRHRRQKRRLGRTESERDHSVDALRKCHESHSRWCGSDGVPPRLG